ncbi:MAG: hypothetical protein U0R51_11460 [Solirubrobacterales bacterium]
MPITARSAGRGSGALAAAAVALAVALVPSGAAAAVKPPSGLRAVTTATGANADAGQFSASAIAIDASSGPAGEDPRGTVDFVVNGLPTSGPVSCMEVTGNVAVLEVEGPLLSVPGAFSMIVRLTDNGGAGADRFDWYPVLPEVGRDYDCETGAPGYFGGPLAGRAIVRKAPPGPKTKRACRHGAWRDYGFRSRRHCFKYAQQ